MNTPGTYALKFKGRREYNQDEAIVVKHGKLIFLGIADGMGGHEAGELASKAVADISDQIISDAAKKEPASDELKSILEKLFSECQQEISRIVADNTEKAGMGTTLSCVLLSGDHYVWGNIGDSRVYHFNGSRLKKITTDHSIIEDYRNQFGSEDIPAYIRSQSNVITRSLSGDGDQPDIYPVDKDFEIIKRDEGFLLCSDGLIPGTSGDDIDWMVKIITGNSNLKDAAEDLVSHAYDLGSNDNISVVLYEHHDFERITVPDFPKYVYPPIEKPVKPKTEIPENKKIRYRGRISLALIALLSFIGYWILFKPFPLPFVPENSVTYPDYSNPENYPDAGLNNDYDAPAVRSEDTVKIKLITPDTIKHDTLLREDKPHSNFQVE